MKTRHSLLSLALVMGLAACANDAEPEAPAAAPAPEATAPEVAADEDMSIQLAAQARVQLAAVQDSGVSGELVFDPAGGGLHLHGRIEGLAPGSVHGFHLHETGDCSAPDATSAGGHFNPDQMQHGDRTTPGPHHAGDMPNLTAGEDGSVFVDVQLEGMTLGDGGSHDVVGRAVIVHAQADDYSTQPTGNAGARIACGVIELSQPAPDYQGPAS